MPSTTWSYQVGRRILHGTLLRARPGIVGSMMTLLPRRVGLQHVRYFLMDAADPGFQAVVSSFSCLARQESVRHIPQKPVRRHNHEFRSTQADQAVSERARVPLYSISAGTLGTNPKDVETALEHALDLCSNWNAMLLLDEADVFLGARTNDGLTRNELVSIFLTKLEYYQGILFLTTNRIASIDHAFQSRVDLFLPYRNLDTAARRQVWANFVNHLGPERFDMTETEIDSLAELKLNGREIKNLIKTAQLLSFRSGGKVTAERLRVLAEKRIEALSVLDT